MIGRDWYKLSRNFADRTPFTWGLNLKSLDVEETIRQARLLSSAFPFGSKRVLLEAIEIGNEPELYVNKMSGGGVENPGDWSLWNVKNYTRTWSDYVKNVAAEVRLGSHTVFRIGDVQLAGTESGWSPQSVIQAGLFDDEFHRKNTKIFSEHLYQAGFDVGHEAASGTLMNKGHIRGNLSSRAPDVHAARCQGLTFVLVSDGVLRAVTEDAGRVQHILWVIKYQQDRQTSLKIRHGSPGTSDVAEAALWAIDYLLYSASLGISRVYLSHGVGYRYSSFQPISGITDDGGNLNRPHTLPLYYGMMVVNEAIGKGSSRRHVVELSTEHRNIASYGIYEDHILTRVVVVNTQLYTKNQIDRPSITVNLNGLNDTMTVKRLVIPYTAAHEGL